jgi:hypothetical protein
MIISESFVYLELHKTGCTHTRNILMQLESLKTKEIGKHNALEELSVTEQTEIAGKKILGNIRNPWDWYVSLWAFGCMGKGGLYKNFPEIPNKNSINGWKEIVRRIREGEEINIDKDYVYANSDDPDRFRIWIKSILNRKVDFGEGYKQNAISKDAGLLTYRYLMLFIKNGVKAASQLKTYDEFIQYEKENNLIDIVIKNESIEKDLLDNSSVLGIDSIEINQLIQQASTKKTNSSKRKDYKYYYDDESRALVKQKEKFIIEKFGYNY